MDISSLAGYIRPVIASGLRRHRLTRTALRLARERTDLRLLRKTDFFDPDAYMRRYPDVASNGIDPTLHYLRHGARAGREPGPLFDARDYQVRYPDVAAAGMNPVVHYLRYGRAHGREVRPVPARRPLEGSAPPPSGQGVLVPAVVRSRGPLLRLAAPVASMESDKLVITCDVDGAPPLRAVHKGPADVLSRIEPRVEPFVPIALLMAGAARYDVVIDAPLDLDFLTVLKLDYVPLLRLLFDFPTIELEAADSAEGRRRDSEWLPVHGCPEPSALLFSGGIDSFYSLTRLQKIDYPLRMLVNLNAGAHCHQACSERRQGQIRQVAAQAGYEALTIDTNFHEVVDVDHLFAHPFRTLAAAYTAYPSIGGLFLSTSSSYEELSYDPHKVGAESLGTTASASLAWNRMPVTEVGYEKRRFDKLKVVADEPLSYQSLDVCVSGNHPPGGDTAAPINCGTCFKCARAILSLDALGRLDRYQSQFDLGGYPANRDDLIRLVRRNDYGADRDLLDRLYGHKPPTSGSMHLVRPTWAQEPSADGESAEPAPWVSGPSKPAIRLYWWRGEDGVPNVGDELSPLIVERVSGRKVVYASPEQCHLVAIGSLAEVALRADRYYPVRLWGTGFIGDGPTLDHRHQGALIEALRGPYSAARLNVGGAVPCGDPGLLVNLLFDGPVTKTRSVGIVPHHSEIDLPAIEAWRSRSDAVIDPHLSVAEFIEAISECDLILSSSLHGLVVADGLGVPNAWVRLSNRVTGHGFKFRDHLRCMGRPEVTPAAETGRHESDSDRRLGERLRSGRRGQDPRAISGRLPGDLSVRVGVMDELPRASVAGPQVVANHDGTARPRTMVAARARPNRAAV